MHVGSWQAAYRTPLPNDYLDQLRPEDRAQKYDFAPLTLITTVNSPDGEGNARAAVPSKRSQAIDQGPGRVAHSEL